MKNTSETIPYPFSKGRTTDWLLFGVTLLFGLVFAWYVFAQGMTMVMVDQYSHNAIARQVIDSKTPGISQLGFWPPLLHMLMVPMSFSDTLYFNGLTAPLILMPLLALSVVFFYHIVFLITRNQPIALATAIMYAVNPYLLYFASTPMTDFLYIGILIIATYFFIHWWKTDHLGSLLIMGLLVGLSPMARFEGFALIAMAGLFILVRLIMRKASYHKIESVAVLYGLLAMIGVSFILIYGTIFNDNPLAFLNDEWSAQAQQEDFFLPTKHSVDISFLYLVHSSGLMMGWPMLVLVFIATLLAPLFVRKERMLFIATSMILISPFLFDWLALWQGSAIIQLPHLPPYDIFYFNERYGIAWIGFALLMPAVVATAIYNLLRDRKWYFMPMGMFVAALIMMIAINVSVTQLKAVACYGCFDVIKQSRQFSSPTHNEIAAYLKEEYDGGNILMTRALHNAIATNSGIPLRNFVMEGNEFYYDQALAYPWLFNRWVVMYSSDLEIGDWYRSREEVSNRWSGSEEFNYYYEKVYDTPVADLYRLREARVREFAFYNNIQESSIPSLNREEHDWDVTKTYQELDNKIKNGVMEPHQATTTPTR